MSESVTKEFTIGDYKFSRVPDVDRTFLFMRHKSGEGTEIKEKILNEVLETFFNEVM